MEDFIVYESVELERRETSIPGYQSQKDKGSYNMMSVPAQAWYDIMLLFKGLLTCEG